MLRHESSKEMTRSETRTRRVLHTLDWRGRVAKVFFWLLVTSAVSIILLLLLITIIPLAFFITIPGLCAAIFVLALALPQLIYIYFADPIDSKKPLFATTLRRCLQVDYAFLRVASETLGVGRRIARDLLLRRVQRNHNYRVFLDVSYGVDDLYLDVYAPLAQEYARVPNPPAPVIVFFPPQIRPFATRKTIFSSLGANLADVVGAVVIIPDLTNYPLGKIRQQVEDARIVLQWVKKNVQRYGGDPQRVYLSGMGTGGLLAQLVPLQTAIVTSREQILAKREGDPTVELPTGVKDVKEYGNTLPLPHIEGLILISPITNVEDQITDEAKRGVQQLSLTRRILGPSERTCCFHSPAHLLYAARNIVKLELLPQKVLFLHGGLDKYIKHTQSETMKEILRGVGIQDVTVKLYTSGHWGTILPLMCDMQGPAVIDEVYNFIWEDNSPTPRTGLTPNLPTSLPHDQI